LIFKGFSRLPTRLFALPLALSMEAHYRDLESRLQGCFRIKFEFLVQPFTNHPKSAFILQ
ncbi:hypothetical protein CF117_13885, partial [Aeromonas veronii]|uniref:hypothetical protein n=1 Tax=Aeromonas veronii TaxID=654 RepID=UPI00195E77AA